VTNDEADGGSSPMKMPHEIASEHSFEKKKRKRGRSSRSLVWTKFGARCCCDKKKRDDRW